jgi:hypothetical protein
MRTLLSSTDSVDRIRRMAQPKLWRESKRAVLQEWDGWSQLNPNEDCVVRFFNYLRSDRPHLLDFQYPGDRWMLVRAWLVSTGRISGKIIPR